MTYREECVLPLIDDLRLVRRWIRDIRKDDAATLPGNNSHRCLVVPDYFLKAIEQHITRVIEREAR